MNRGALMIGSASLALLAASLGSQSAQAQTAPAAEQDDSHDSIVVTARRREESVQDVPIAVTALSGEQVQQSGAVGLSQVQQLAPSLQITATNPRNTNINIRGLGATPAFASLGLEYGSGVYVDQVYYSRPTQAAFDLYDIQRVEVLRGPQGTLFGKNTTAGAISIVTEEPSFTPEMRGELSFANDSFYQARASASAPLSDTVALRLTFTDTNRDRGVQQNVRLKERMHDLKTVSMRAQLLFTPTDKLKFRLIGDYSDFAQNGLVGVNRTFRTTRVDGSTLPNNFFVRAARFNYTPLPVDLDARQVDLNRTIFVKIKTYGGTLIGDYDLGGATVTSVTGYRELQFRPKTDGDVTGLDIFVDAGVRENQRQFSQELRIASNGGGPLDYVAGLYYFDQRIDDEFFTIYGPDAALWILGPAAGSTQASPAFQNALNGLTANGAAFAETKSYAAFAEGTWHAGPFDLTAGLRYTNEEKNGAFSQVQVGPALSATDVLFGGQAIRNNFAANIPEYVVSSKEDNISGRATISYRPSEAVMLYATYSRGFKSGGLNLNATAAPRVIAPEKIEAYEAGAKSQFFDRRLTVNLAVYQQTIKNYQSQQIDTAVAQTAYIANVGTVRSTGFEADVRARIIDGVSLFGSLAYTDAKYLNFTNAPCPVEYFGLQTICNLSGARLPGVSKVSWSAGVNASLPLDDGGKIEFNADYAYRSNFFTTYNLAADSLAPGYGLANVRVGYETADGRFNLSVFARNLFDTTYISIINPSAFNTGQSTATLGDPASYGVTFKVAL